MNSILDEVAKRTISLILQEPFYGHFASSLLKKESEEVEQLAVSSTDQFLIQLSINPTYWKRLDRNQQLGALKHEVLHIVFQHLIRVRDFEDKRLFHIAADLVVNQYLSPRQLPKDAILFSQFQILELASFQDVSYYYSRLFEFRRQIALNKRAPVHSTHLFIDKLLAEKPAPLKRHQLWEKQHLRMPSWDLKILERSLEAQIRNILERVGIKEIGKLPGGLQITIQKLLQKKEQIDWRRVLRIFTSATGKTSLKNTIRRPSKRYGTTPGIKIKQEQKLLVGVDTSGSISDRDIALFFREIHWLWTRGIELRIVECDATIQNNYLYKGKIPTFASGKGGTDYTPVLKWANEVYLPDGIIYFTDGYAKPPEVQSRKPILWVISSGGITEGTGIWDSLNGRKVKLN